MRIPLMACQTVASVYKNFVLGLSCRLRGETKSAAADNIAGLLALFEIIRETGMLILWLSRDILWLDLLSWLNSIETWIFWLRKEIQS